jgi:signal transduction histidine kinase
MTVRGDSTRCCTVHAAQYLCSTAIKLGSIELVTNSFGEIKGIVMGLSIRAWTILALNTFVIGESLILGWISQNVAGEVVEERLATDMVSNVSSFLANRPFPVSDSMMNYLRQMLSLDWVAVSDDGAHVIGSSLPDTRTTEFIERLRTVESAGIVSLDGSRFRIGMHDIPIHADQPGSSNPATNHAHLYVLIPVERFDETRRQASRRVAGMVIPATCAATLLAIVLAFVTTRPIRKLTQEMNHLANLEERSATVESSSDIVSSTSEKKPRPDQRASMTNQGLKETRQLATSFYGLLDRLASARGRLAQSERLATLGKVSLSVAHELRNPLSGIKMNMRILQDRIGPEDEAEVEAILREIDRMGLYLDELMNFAPGTGSTGKVHAPVPVKLSTLADSVLTILSGRCRHARIVVQRDYAALESLVIADPNQIRQAMMNFIVNAIEAMPLGGTLAISLRPRDSIVVFRVADTGRGVQADGIDIFDAFTSGKPDGVGLGLYLSRQIIHRHAGRIGYDNGVAGAVFWFELPRAPDNPVPVGSTAESELV